MRASRERRERNNRRYLPGVRGAAKSSPAESPSGVGTNAVPTTTTKKPLPEGHVVAEKDRVRIGCSHGGLGSGQPRCPNPAYYCEYKRGSGSLSFWYFCEEHTGLDKHYDDQRAP